MKLLVVDWDFFFPDPNLMPFPEDEEERVERALTVLSLYDWGHSEHMLFMSQGVWAHRASAFMHRGVELPQMNEQKDYFWSRFRIKPRAQLFFADSNMHAANQRVSRNVDEVWLYDAHHDSGYKADSFQTVFETQKVTCEDWMVGYKLFGAELHYRYPQWAAADAIGQPESKQMQDAVDIAQDDDSDNPVVFDRVFVCRSGSWVPTWCDQQFLNFIAEAPVARRICMDESDKPRPDMIEEGRQMLEHIRAIETNPIRRAALGEGSLT